MAPSNIMATRILLTYGADTTMSTSACYSGDETTKFIFTLLVKKHLTLTNLNVSHNVVVALVIIQSD